MRNGILFVVLLATSAACAQQTQPTSQSQPAATEPTTCPATLPSQPTTTTAPSQPAVDPLAMLLLKRLEAAGEKHDTIQASLVYTIKDPSLGDEEVRTGTIRYQKDTKTSPKKFRITFETTKLGAGPVIKELKDYAFDGQWLYIAEHVNKKLTKYQVAAPGEKVDPFRIGKGPFPLPFGQKVADMAKYFDITTRPVEKDEPQGTAYLKLVTKRAEKANINFLQLEEWVDPKFDFPVKLVAREQNKMVTTVVFQPLPKKRDISINEPLEESIFTIERPAGWTTEIRPLGDNKP